MEDLDSMLRDAGVGSGPVTDTPPQAQTPPKSEVKLTPKWRDLRESIDGFYTAAAVAAFAFGDAETSALISSQQETCVNAWVDLAQKDKRVESFLVKITTGSAWGAVVMAHMGILIPMLAKHGILPGGALFGAFSGSGASGESSPSPASEPLFPDSGVVSAQNGNGN